MGGEFEAGYRVERLLGELEAIRERERRLTDLVVRLVRVEERERALRLMEAEDRWERWLASRGAANVPRGTMNSEGGA